jgi:hypothetical protein
MTGSYSAENFTPAGCLLQIAGGTEVLAHAIIPLKAKYAFCKHEETRKDSASWG